jgi:hypothetical protein
MSNGMHERLMLDSLRTSYGCVDWYPYDRHPPGKSPAGASRPDPPARTPAATACRPSPPRRRLAPWPARGGADGVVLRL